MDMVPLLAPSGHRRVCPDRPGCGRWACMRSAASANRETVQCIGWMRSGFSALRPLGDSGAWLLSGHALLVWLMAAQSIYVADAGAGTTLPRSAHLRQRCSPQERAGRWSSSEPRSGSYFALCALAISVVSFPLLLDRKVGVPVAVVTSVPRVAAQSRRDPDMGLHRGGAAGAGRDSDAAGTDRGHAGAGPRDMASVSPRGRLNLPRGTTRAA